MSWVPEIHIGDMRPWPEAVQVVRGETNETRRYVPCRTARTADRRIRSHDGIGRCTCSECGGSVGMCDRYCKHCSAEFVANVYEGRGTE